MKFKITIIIVVILLTTGLASAQITFDDSNNIQFNTGLDLSGGQSIVNYYDRSACGSGEYMSDIQDDGTIVCSIPYLPSGSQNLSQVLEEGNIANQSMRIKSGVAEAITVNRIGSGDAEIRAWADSNGESRLELYDDNVMNEDWGAGFAYNSAYGGVTGDNRLRIYTVDSGDQYDVLTAGRSQSGVISSFRDIEMKSNNIESLDQLRFSSGRVEIGDSNTYTKQDQDIAIGSGANASADQGYDSATAIGNGASATENGTLALGEGSNADYEYATSLGPDTTARKNGIAVGHGAESNGFENSISIGTESASYESDAITLGYLANTTGDGAISIGRSADATSNGAISIGRSADATSDGAVAIGKDSIADESNTVEFGSSSQAYDVQVNGGGKMELRASSSGQPVLDYRMQEGSDYGAFVRYDSSFDSDSDNRLVLATENEGTEHEALSADRSGTFVELHRNTDISGDLDVSGNIDSNDYDISYSTGHTAWSSGLSSEEVNRWNLQSGEEMVIDRLEVAEKGGGSSNLDVTVADGTNSWTVNPSGTSVRTGLGPSVEGSTVTVEVTNNAGSDVTASITISGEVR